MLVSHKPVLKMTSHKELVCNYIYSRVVVIIAVVVVVVVVAAAAALNPISLHCDGG